MTQSFLNFRRLLDPLPVEAFFDEHLDEGPAFVGGEAAKTAGLIGWDGVTASLNNSKLWSSIGLTLRRNGVPVPAQEYSFQGINRDLQPVPRPDPVLVLEILAKGAVLELRDVESISPSMMRLTQALASALGGSARSRLTGSGPTEPAEIPDFDVGDVFHIQLDGSSYWALFEERATPGGVTQPAELAGEVEMTAGDMLYLPSGQFYRKAGASEGCLTLAVTVMRASGAELIAMIHEHLTDQAFFRADLPFYDDAAAHEAHLERLAAVVEEIIGGDGFADRVADFQRRLMALSKHAAFSLPSHEIASLYRVGVRRELPVGLDPVTDEVARWAREAEIFTLADLRQAFGAKSAYDIAAALESLERCGFAEPALREVTP